MLGTPALAFVLTVGDVGRFAHSRELSSYVGLIPRESSSGAKRKLGAITKQGNQFLRTLLVEAAQSAVRYDAEMRREYQHRCHHKAKGVAKVAAARKLAVRLYWMLRTQKPYRQGVHIEGSPGHSVVGTGRPIARVGALASRARGGMSAGTIMVRRLGRPYRWLGGTGTVPQKMIEG